MTRRNDKRNSRRNRQRNNNPELPEFASMLFGALLGKGVDMIAKKMAENAEEETPDIHAEGISNQDVTNINNGKASLTKCTIPTDGTAVELPIPDNLQVFISEDGKPMIRKKIEGDEKKTPDDKEGNPITYDSLSKKLYLGNDKVFYWDINKDPKLGDIATFKCTFGYGYLFNCMSKAQVKRMMAFNKLQNIAKYLNRDWKPDFDDEDTFNWSIIKECGSYGAQYNMSTNEGSVYFKSAELAQQAIRLMGEESLNDLFSTDW